MNEHFNIIIDTYGSDLGEKEIVNGALKIIRNHQDIDITLVGDKNLINDFLKEEKVDINRIKIINTNSFISNEENIINSFYDKNNASIFLAIKELANDVNSIGLISPGNSGAMLLGCMKYLKNDQYIRPCLGAILPTFKDNFVCLVDAGATLDCNSHQLVDFAKLGSKAMTDLFNIKNPKIALLSNGVEAHKGNKLVKETHILLEQEKSLNFVGNIEANNVFDGDVDVVTGDGFVINQLLKAFEGISTNMIKYLYESNTNNNGTKSLLNDLKNKYDFPNLGGGIILGCKKMVIKCRGNANKEAIYNSATMLINLAKNQNIYLR